MCSSDLFQNMMVFRRAKAEAKAAPVPAPMIEDKRAEAATAPAVAAPAVTAPAAMPVAGSATTAAEPKSDKTPGVGAADPAHKG